jgi:hypothetical protein
MSVLEIIRQVRRHLEESGRPAGVGDRRMSRLGLIDTRGGVVESDSIRYHPLQ